MGDASRPVCTSWGGCLCATATALEQAKMHVGNWDFRNDDGSAEPQQTVALYSPQEVLTRKDFSKMAGQELLRVQRLITAMARELATLMSRRKKAGVKAHDRPRTDHAPEPALRR